MCPMKPCSNIDLQRYRAKDYFLREPSNGGDKLFSFVSQLVLLLLWKSLSVVFVPFSRVLACYLWTGRSIYALFDCVEHSLLRIVGWFGASAFSRSHAIGRLSRHYVAFNVRRWHVGLGEEVAIVEHPWLFISHIAILHVAL